ncbi:MAG: hypothetical protein J6S92_00165 [Oscillospiraceae bacterium]|nr:hypothetical protein [Oscillospiraceae bacterium]
MRNKVFAAMASAVLSVYGIAGFWSNLGNETISPVLFASILAAMVLAPIAVIVFSCLRSGGMSKQRIGGAGVLSLLLSAVSFVGFWFWLSTGDMLASVVPHALISGLFLSCSAAALVYAVTCFILAVFKRNRRNTVSHSYTAI